MTNYHVSISNMDAFGHHSDPEILEWEAPGFTKSYMRAIWDHLQFNTDGANGSVTTALLSVDGQTVRAFQFKLLPGYLGTKQYYQLTTIDLRPDAYYKPEILREGVWSE